MTAAASGGRLRIAFMGAGRRMAGVYLPVARALGDFLEPVGFASRDKAKGEAAAAEMGLPWFPDLPGLVEGARPDLIALCVPPAANAGLALQAIARKVAVLMETPVSPSLSEARALARAAAAAKAVVGVAEQKPFLPLEQLKRKVIEAGALGRVSVAHNAFRSYDYHAIAQLRAYLRGDACVRVRCLSRSAPLRGKPGPDGAPGRPRLEKWDFATVETASGALLVHEFSDAYKSSAFRIGPGLKVFGETGTLADGELAFQGSDGVTHTVRVEGYEAGAPRAPRRLSFALEGIDAAWDNPFADHALADDQVGLACHFAAMRDAVLAGSPPLYGLRDAIADLEIVAAMRLSSRLGGCAVNLPLSLPREAAAIAFTPALWGRVLGAILRRGAKARG